MAGSSHGKIMLVSSGRSIPASFALFLLSAAAVHQTGAFNASSPRFAGQPLPAFCASTNSPASKHWCFASVRTPLRAAEKSEVESALDEMSEEKDTGTWNPLSLAVLKLGFTEPAWTSSLNYKKAEGTYVCADCRIPLFSSGGKYDSGSGWPSFWKTVESNRVALEREWDGRIECKCAKCGGHLGHVFPDGPTRGSLKVEELATVPETDPQIGYKVQGDDGANSKYSRMPRYCVNGVALRFEEKE